MGFLRYCLRTEGPVETLTKSLALIAGSYVGWKMGSDLVMAAKYFSRVSALDYAINESPLVAKLAVTAITASAAGFVGKFPGRFVDYIHSNSKKIFGQ